MITGAEHSHTFVAPTLGIQVQAVCSCGATRLMHNTYQGDYAPDEWEILNHRPKRKGKTPPMKPNTKRTAPRHAG